MPRPALPLFRPILLRLVAWVGAQAGFATVLAAWVGAQAGFVPRVRVRVRDRVSFSVSSSCRPEKAQFHTVE